jgi:putative chitinase
MPEQAELIAQLRQRLADAGIIVDRIAALEPALAVSPVAPVAPVPPPAAAGTGAEHPQFGAEGAFYNWLRGNNMLGPSISRNELDGCIAITNAAAAAQWGVGWTAYALATAYHETAHTMLPIGERGGDAYFTRLYDVTGQDPARARRYGNTTPGDGPLYHGRGYVQLTWKANYERAARELGVDFAAHPELALEPVNAANIMTRGMAEGWFTGKRLVDYVTAGQPGSVAAFTEARRIINGTDRAAEIANYALNFQSALTAGQWRL